ncbi:MAG: acetamidase/formamidase family protein [Candidatus Bathycorpusculaceae bacterium]
MKIVPRNKIIYSFNPEHKPAVHVKPGEIVLVETEDALGGQVKSETDFIEKLDWSRVDGATGPVFVETAKPGDTLIVEILDIKTEDHGVIVTVPKYGILHWKPFNASAKIVKINEGYVIFDSETRVKTSPMIGTIGVAPEAGDIPAGSLGKHGGNMDVKKLTAGVKLYLPVFTEGAMFAAGDIHAVQADGELCVSSVEVAGEILLRFNIIKGKSPEWPVLETRKSFEILACGENLDEAAKIATENAVKALMREHGWSFEKAYMFGSLVVDLKINQVVDPKKGVRAAIPRDYISLKSLIP